MELELNPELIASRTLSAVEKSRGELLRKAAGMLLGWNRPVEEIMEITGLSKTDIESLRDAKADTTSQK
ncbi:MAG: hypothetical protein LBP99_02475 [Azoarcus sp.]|jgi:hypothetical protein|nr:hypothetical protein [Azoarcus sp.]